MEADTSGILELLQTLGVAIGGLALALKAGFDLLGKKKRQSCEAPAPAIDPDALAKIVDAVLKDSIPCHREKETCGARIATLWAEQIKPSQEAVKTAVDRLDDNVDDVYVALAHIAKSTTGTVPVTRRKR